MTSRAPISSTIRTLVIYPVFIDSVHDCSTLDSRWVVTRPCAGDIPLCHAGCLICIYLFYFSADTGASQSTSADNILKAKGACQARKLDICLQSFSMKLITPGDVAQDPCLPRCSCKVIWCYVRTRWGRF